MARFKQWWTKERIQTAVGCLILLGFLVKAYDWIRVATLMQGGVVIEIFDRGDIELLEEIFEIPSVQTVQLIKFKYIAMENSAQMRLCMELSPEENDTFKELLLKDYQVSGPDNIYRNTENSSMTVGEEPGENRYNFFSYYHYEPLPPGLFGYVRKQIKRGNYSRME